MISQTTSKLKVDPRDGKLAMAHFYVAFIALALGGLMGLLQTLVRSGKFELPWGIDYYQILTVHGVLMGLVLTTFFIMGFQYAAVSRTAGTHSPKARRIGWIGFWVMTVGTIMAATMVLLKEASVLYTFYAPLKAHWIFYLGLTFVIVGSWLDGAAQIMTYARWRKENPGKPSPLLSFMAIINTVMWIIATLGVAATVLFQLLPWSLGLVDTVDVLVSRTLILVFWTSTRIFLVTSCLYVLVCNHTKNYRRKNFLGFTSTSILYPVFTFLYSCWFPPSINGARN